MPQVCSGCGTENADNVKFCGSCGRSLSSAGTAKLTFLDSRYEVLTTIKSGAKDRVTLTRYDSSGRSSGFRATYTGTRNGRSVEGTFSFVNEVGKSGTGSWRASW